MQLVKHFVKVNSLKSYYPAGCFCYVGEASARMRMLTISLVCSLIYVLSDWMYFFR